jgi:hypothetical protein
VTTAGQRYSAGYLSIAVMLVTQIGCVSSANSGPTITTPLADNRGVAIPEGAGGDLAKKQPVVFLDIKTIDSCKDAKAKLDPGAIQLARTVVEAQLPRMKRFTVYSIYNDAGIRKGRELGDTGIAAEVDQEQLPAPDLLLNITATINSEMNEDKTQAKQLVVCTASVTYTLTDAKGKVLADTQYASGTIKTPSPKPGEKLSEMRNVREITRYYDPSTKQWRSAGGFDPSNPEGAAALVRQTLDSPLKGLVAKLAMALPLTTQVTGISGSKSMFSVGAGQRNGIFRGGKVVVWYSDGDFSYPIAETTAEPTVDKCNLKIVSWNDGDADAKPIIDKIKSKGIDDIKGKLWATTEGIPIEEMLAP